MTAAIRRATCFSFPRRCTKAKAGKIPKAAREPVYDKSDRNSDFLQAAIKWWLLFIAKPNVFVGQIMKSLCGSRSSVLVASFVILNSVLLVANGGGTSRAYAQVDGWMRPPEQLNSNAPPIVHDLFAPQPLPVVKDPPRNSMFYPAEEPAAKGPPTVHELTLPELDARFRDLVASRRGMEQLPYFEQLVNSNRYTPEQATELMKDRTVLTFDKTYGSQIEYTSTDGISYLWFPGYPMIVRGQWYIRDEEVGFTEGSDRFVSKAGRICYYYGSGNPQCQNAGVHEARALQSRAGDVFGLAKSEAVPFVLSDESTSLDDVLKRIKKAKKSAR